MGDAPGQSADGFHFLGLAYLGLEAPVFVLGGFAAGNVGNEGDILIEAPGRVEKSMHRRLTGSASRLFLSIFFRTSPAFGYARVRRGRLAHFPSIPEEVIRLLQSMALSSSAE